MANIIETVKTEALRYVTFGVFGIITFLLTGLFQEILPDIQSPVFLNIWEKAQNKLILLLALALILALLFLYHYRKKSFILPPSGGYTFQEDPGFYINKKTRGHYCNPCLSKGYASRLSIHHADGLKCRLCGEVYIDQKSDSAAFAEYAKR